MPHHVSSLHDSSMCATDSSPNRLSTTQLKKAIVATINRLQKEVTEEAATNSAPKPAKTTTAPAALPQPLKVEKVCGAARPPQPMAAGKPPPPPTGGNGKAAA